MESMSSPRKEKDFNKDWLFSLEGEEAWSPVILPHDWSIALGYDREKGDGATGYVLGGVGWYRKHFQADLRDDQVCYLLFDGVYNNSELWINGRKAGCHPYGYSPFYFDITSFLHQGGRENLIALKVDRRRYVDSRWYTGSGIYRPVRLIMTESLHTPVWGSFLFCRDVSGREAAVQARYTVENRGSRSRRYRAVSTILSPGGKEVGRAEQTGTIAAGTPLETAFLHNLESPRLWDTEAPALYTARLSLYEGETLTDRKETPFGIRDIRFDPDKGFFLNGRNRKIKGVCLHQDGGLTGTAVPRDVWKCRLTKLKAMGCNAIRSSHHPCSEVLLDLCDEMGFLVQDEFYDEWDYPKDKRLNMEEQHDDFLSRGYCEHFGERAETDLKSTVLSHRNHPSIFQWSIGNEIEWTYPRNMEATGFFDADARGNYFWTLPPHPREEIRRRLETLPRQDRDIAETARRLARWTRETDPTRPVTANCILPSASFESGYTDALDMVGFSYRRVLYDYARKHYPQKAVMGTENLGQWHEWKAVEERDFIPGAFIWTGIDYLGEAHKKSPDKKGTDTGFLDLAGFEKPSYHFYRSLWDDAPHIRLFTQTEELSPFTAARGDAREKAPGAWQTRLWDWHTLREDWNFSPGETVIVEAYTNCCEAELFLNGESRGVRVLQEQEDRICKWALPFRPGELTVRGRHAGGTAEDRIVTAGEPERIALSWDRELLKANGTDCLHVTARLVDGENRLVTHRRENLCFAVSGPARVLGHDNGAVTNWSPPGRSGVTTHRGHALMILQTREEPGTLKITVEGADLKGAEAALPIIR